MSDAQQVVCQIATRGKVQTGSLALPTSGLHLLTRPFPPPTLKAGVSAMNGSNRQTQGRQAVRIEGARGGHSQRAVSTRPRGCAHLQSEPNNPFVVGCFSPPPVVPATLDQGGKIRSACSLPSPAK